MTRTPWLRILVVAVPPLVLALWLSIPLFDPPSKTVLGQATPAKYCLVGCSAVLQVDGLLLGCKAEPLGLSHRCPDGLVAPGEVEATYVRLPSLASLLGVSRVAGTLIRLQRGKTLVYSHSVSSVVREALQEASPLHLVYWPLAGFVIWRWPNSRFSRRATWRGTKAQSDQSKPFR